MIRDGKVTRWLDDRGKHGIEVKKVIINPLKTNLILSDDFDFTKVFVNKPARIKIITRPEHVFDWSINQNLLLKSFSDFGWKHRESIKAHEKKLANPLGFSVNIETSVRNNYSIGKITNRQAELVFDVREYLFKNDRWKQNWFKGREGVITRFILDPSIRDHMDENAVMYRG